MPTLRGNLSEILDETYPAKTRDGLLYTDKLHDPNFNCFDKCDGGMDRQTDIWTTAYSSLSIYAAVH